MPGLRAFALKGLAIINKIYQEENISYESVMDENLDKMIIDEDIEYTIRKGKIELNLEWHYLRKRCSKDLVDYVINKKGDVFNINQKKRLTKLREKLDYHNFTSEETTISDPFGTPEKSSTNTDIIDLENYFAKYISDKVDLLKKRFQDAEELDLQCIKSE